MEIQTGTCERCEAPDCVLFPLDPDLPILRCADCCQGGLMEELRREAELAEESRMIWEGLANP